VTVDLLRELAGLRDFAVVDAHHHLWDLEHGHYPWLQDEYSDDTFMGDYRRLCSSYGPAQYLSDMQGLCIGATVHVEAERARDESLQETIWLDSLSNQYQGLAAAVVPWVDLWADDVAERIDAQVNANPRVRAVRAKPRLQSAQLGDLANAPLLGSLSDVRLTRGFHSLLERGLGWDLRVPWPHLAEAAERLSDVPQLRVVINHAGLPWDRSEAGLSQWGRSMQSLADLPHVYVKLSEFSAPRVGWNASQARRIIATALDLFGAQRCMFASNLPVTALTVSIPSLVRAIADAVDPGDEQALRCIFMETACRAYRIGTVPRAAGR
jgi:predicted TIM-barrel fold metal-dependent hydrolase